VIGRQLLLNIFDRLFTAFSDDISSAQKSRIFFAAAADNRTFFEEQIVRLF
jgi:hypothetical protein